MRCVCARALMYESRTIHVYACMRTVCVHPPLYVQGVYTHHPPARAPRHTTAHPPVTRVRAPHTVNPAYMCTPCTLYTRNTHSNNPTHVYLCISVSCMGVFVRFHRVALVGCIFAFVCAVQRMTLAPEHARHCCPCTSPVCARMHTLAVCKACTLVCYATIHKLDAHTN